MLEYVTTSIHNPAVAGSHPVKPPFSLCNDITRLLQIEINILSHKSKCWGTNLEYHPFSAIQVNIGNCKIVVDRSLKFLIFMCTFMHLRM